MVLDAVGDGRVSDRGPGGLCVGRAGRVDEEGEEVTLDDLQERLAYWQKVLRLQDWDVSVEIVRRHKVSGRSMGHSDISDMKRAAHILIADPSDYEGDWFDERFGDIERVLVHELLHLNPPLQDNSRETEQTVHAISMALLGLERKG